MPLFPYSFWDCAWLAPVALVLDLAFGDPRLPWPHPVCLIGKFLDLAESIARRLAGRACSDATRARRERLAGFAALFLAAGGSFACIWLCCQIPFCGAIFALYFAWAGLAMGCLLSTGNIVLERVENSPLSQARAGVSWLVSRDTSQMDRAVLRKTLADTLAENYTDAFLAPFFWLALLGPAGLWAYKAVSTMDSQWGYLTPRWRELGMAGARADDCLAYIPARISPFPLYIAHLMLKIGAGRWPGYGRITRDAAGMTSPNSGWPMAACAWLCAGRMAGPSVYFGEIVHKGWIGAPDAPPWSRESLAALMRLLFWGSVCGGVLICCACILVKALA